MTAVISGRRSSVSRGTLLWPVLFFVIVTGDAAPGGLQRDAPGVKHALLVGVTRIPVAREGTMARGTGK